MAIDPLAHLKASWQRALENPVDANALRSLSAMTRDVFYTELHQSPDQLTTKKVVILTEIADNMHCALQNLQSQQVPGDNQTSANLQSELNAVDRELQTNLRELEFEDHVLNILFSEERTEQLEDWGNYYYLKFTRTENAIYASYTVKFLEKAARLYERAGEPLRAAETRMKLAKMRLLTSRNPLTNIERDLNQGQVRYRTKFGVMNEGITLDHLDSCLIKKSKINVKREPNIHGKLVDTYNFKVLDHAGDDVRRIVHSFKEPGMRGVMDQAGIGSISVTEEPFYYFKREGEKLINDPEQALAMGRALVLTVEGVGTIRIGNDPEMGETYNRVLIQVDPEGSLEKLQQMASMVGLSSAICEQTPADLHRLKVNKLLHFLYPREMTHMHLTYGRQIYEYPVDSILAICEDLAPGAKAHIEKYLPGMVFVRSFTRGQQFYMLQGVSSQLEQRGLRGFIHGVGGTRVKNAASSVASIMQVGCIPSNVRCENGFFSEGSSVRLDHETGGAHYFFTRAVTQRACNARDPINQLALGGLYQIIFPTSAAEGMPDCRESDCYGLCNLNATGVDQTAYTQRPNLMELVQQCESGGGTLANEVLFRHIDPNIAAITYQDPRKQILPILLKNPHFFPLDYVTMEQRLNYMMQHAPSVQKELVLQTLLEAAPNYFPEECAEHSDRLNYIAANYDSVLALVVGKYKEIDGEGYFLQMRINEYWLIDPRAELIAEFRQSGLMRPENEAFLSSLIQERTHFSDQMFANAHSLGRRALTIEATRRNWFAYPYLYIERLRNELARKSEQELSVFYRDYLPQIKELKEGCQQNLYHADQEGSDSLNRQLLTDTGWNDALRNPTIIIALFALEAARNKNVDEATDLITFDQDTGPAQITDMIYFGLLNNPLALLESLPLNGPDREGYLETYVKRKNINNFGAILGAVSTASTLFNSTPFDLPKPRRIDQPYSPESWENNKVAHLLSSVVTEIENIPIEDLLKNNAQYTPEQLTEQSRQGFIMLCEKMLLDPSQCSLEELVERIASTPYLLDPGISHFLYDRIHLLAALRDRTPLTAFPLKGGQVVHIGEIMMALVEHISKKGVSVENAIAAEQLYIRITHLADQLNI